MPKSYSLYHHIRYKPPSLYQLHTFIMSTTSSQTYTDIVSQGNSDPISNYDGNIYVVKSYEDKGVQVPDLSEELSQDNIDKDSSEIYISDDGSSGDTFLDEYTLCSQGRLCVASTGYMVPMNCLPC